ncbi:MAG: 13E12 repeat family protein, partial [Actinomycetota bacterium]|nr:13E12 repeat family protein [Actinomycetota bacterium]
MAERSDLELETEITTLHSRISAETCQWLLLVAEYDRREAYRKVWGARHMADWLSWHCGVGVRTAQEQVRVSRRLADLPLTQELFAKGELSYSKVRAISRAEDTENEEMLVKLARNATASQIERIVSSYRRAKASADEGEREALRFASWDLDEDGCLRLRARLSPDEGAVFLRALELAREEILRERSHECEEAERGVAPEHTSARTTNADALVRLAEGTLAETGATATGGDSTQVVVHVDLDALDEGAARLTPTSVLSELDSG